MTKLFHENRNVNTIHYVVRESPAVRQVRHVRGHARVHGAERHGALAPPPLRIVCSIVAMLGWRHGAYRSGRKEHALSSDKLCTVLESFAKLCCALKFDAESVTEE